MPDHAAKSPPPHTAAEFETVVEKLHAYLHALLDSPVYGRGPTRVAPPKNHGVYLFSEEHEGQLRHLYVGRVGLTERAKAKGSGHSNFRTRLAGHSIPGASHNQASFAYRLTVEALGADLAAAPATRAGRNADATFAAEYTKQKERVTAMDFRVVRIDDDFESYVFEPYAAFRLGTPYNSWATS